MDAGCLPGTLTQGLSSIGGLQDTITGLDTSALRAASRYYVVETTRILLETTEYSGEGSSL